MHSVAEASLGRQVKWVACGPIENRKCRCTQKRGQHKISTKDGSCSNRSSVNAKLAINGGASSVVSLVRVTVEFSAPCEQVRQCRERWIIPTLELLEESVDRVNELLSIYLLLTVHSRDQGIWVATNGQPWALALFRSLTALTMSSSSFVQLTSKFTFLRLLPLKSFNSSWLNVSAILGIGFPYFSLPFWGEAEVAAIDCLDTIHGSYLDVPGSWKRVMNRVITLIYPIYH